MSRKSWAVLSVLLVALLAITACAPVPAAPAQHPSRRKPPRFRRRLPPNPSP